MPASDNRKIISLAALSEFKTKYDAFVNNTFVPYSGANTNVNLGNNNLTVHGLSILAPTSDVAQIAKDNGSGTLNISAGANGDVTFYSHGHTYYLPGASGATDDYTLATKADVSTLYKFQGNATVAQLNGDAQSGNITVTNPGDTYNITDGGLLDNVGPDHTDNYRVNAGDNVAWVQPGSNPGYWDVLAGTLDTSNFVTNSQLNTTLAGYLPLSAGSGNALTGSLYLGSNSVNFGSSGDSLIEEASGHLTFQSHDDTFRYIGTDEDAVISVDNLTATRTFRYPDESGTLVTGEYATTGSGGDIAALFN